MARTRKQTEPFRVLVGDPPWPLNDKLPGKTRGAAKQYETLTVEQIKRYPLPPIADAALLFLWRVSSMQEEALEVVRAWGFTPKTELVWLKLSTGGERLHMGMGRILRGAHETCLVAARGRYVPEVLDKGVRTVLLAPVVAVEETGKIKHSAKPESFYDVVESVFPGPYAELFARTRRNAMWTQWGDELEGRPAHP